MQILVLEDEAFFGAYLISVCQSLFSHGNVRSAQSVAAARSAAAGGCFDLLVLDISLPDGDGFDFAEEALAIQPSLRIVGISADCTDYCVHRLEKSPIRVFVDKQSHSPQVLSDAVHAAMSGAEYYSPSIAAIKRNLEDPASFTRLLTNKEVVILSRVGIGFSDSEIAADIGVSSWTVNWHRRQLMRRLGLKNRAELIVFANKKGLSHLHPSLISRAPFAALGNGPAA